MERAAGTERADLEALYRRHEAALLRLAFVLVGVRGDAEDLVQAAFLALARAEGSVRDPAAYLRGVVVRRAQDQHRRSFRRLPRPPDPIVAEPGLDETWAHVQRLPPAQRVVVVLRFYEDLALVDIAQLTGRPEGTVRSDLHRALTRLRRALADEGATSDV
jgi:DNA-directed RNA polymerase specialized sigma24 family protein